MNMFMRSGSMFDRGIYFADLAGKSVGYCRAASRDMALMLLCEVEVGHTMMSLGTANYTSSSLVKSSNSCAVLGQGSTPYKQWRDAGHVHTNLKGILMPDFDAGSTTTNRATTILAHNDYIVYDPAQVRQRYLFKFQMP